MTGKKLPPSTSLLNKFLHIIIGIASVVAFIVVVIAVVAGLFYDRRTHEFTPLFQSPAESVSFSGFALLFCSSWIITFLIFYLGAAIWSAKPDKKPPYKPHLIAATVVAGTLSTVVTGATMLGINGKVAGAVAIILLFIAVITINGKKRATPIISKKTGYIVVICVGVTVLGLLAYDKLRAQTGPYRVVYIPPEVCTTDPPVSSCEPSEVILLSEETVESRTYVLPGFDNPSEKERISEIRQQLNIADEQNTSVEVTIRGNTITAAWPPK